MFECESDDRIIFILIKTKHSVHIMVFGVVTNDSDLMIPLFFPRGLRLNMEAYIKCLLEV